MGEDPIGLGVGNEVGGSEKVTQSCDAHEPGTNGIEADFLKVFFEQSALIVRWTESLNVLLGIGPEQAIARSCQQADMRLPERGAAGVVAGMASRNDIPEAVAPT